MTTIDIHEAAAPFALRCTAPRYHASTDALIGSYDWTDDRRFACADGAARAAVEMGKDSDAEYTVTDALGRVVGWPELGPDLPPGWWTSAEYKRSLGLDADAILF